jgi:hypothetical protein
MTKDELIESLVDRIEVFKMMSGNVMKTEDVVRLLQQVMKDVTTM